MERHHPISSCVLHFYYLSLTYLLNILTIYRVYLLTYLYTYLHLLITYLLLIGGLMASGAKNQLPLVNVLGALLL